MKNLESLEDFFQNNQVSTEVDKLFNVFELEEFCKTPTHYSRKDYYKISLLKSFGRVLYADGEVDVNQPALMFTSPITPYSWESAPGDLKGYFCIFKEEFLKESKFSESVQNSPLFNICGTKPIFFLNESEYTTLEIFFIKMIEVSESEYQYKYELLRNYVSLIIHEAMQLSPTESSEQPTNASKRITTLFLELLEQQFPIVSTSQPLTLKSASDFAKVLSVHVNHLNFSVREITGKSTTAHITDRILAEANILLRNTDWPIADIAFSLGFNYPTYFNNFFKKKTGCSPKSLRK
ncbi:helix-turn-helix domain-containing protein [Sphingobacterium endophyticum]|uniref:helix-turn-helix domain-containing protein n=1 Tax=Sphingobacterium endophyticum TaxID=2546448 RepID=UPI0012E18C56|nr:helix-turn-helix domain-containing protein [Sphingobacterium endophyticum]